MKQAIKEHGKPEIINSDQGSQFTCELWIERMTKEGIIVSMDGKGRAIDNIFIERFWRSFFNNGIVITIHDNYPVVKTFYSNRNQLLTSVWSKTNYLIIFYNVFFAISISEILII